MLALTNNIYDSIMLTEVNKYWEKKYDIKIFRRIYKNNVCAKKTKWKYKSIRYSKQNELYKAKNNLKEEKLVKYEIYGTIELTQEGENLAKKILETYDIVYIFLKEVLNLEEQEAEQEAERIKQVITDETTNKLAKYVHKVLGLNNLDCDYDINKEKCRSCARRTKSRKETK